MAKRKPKRKPEAIQVVEPTPEQFAKGDFRRANMAYKRTPVIETLFNAGKLTHRQYAALLYYREQAHQAEDDYKRSGPLDPERIMGGGGGSGGSGLPLVCTSAILETGRIERDLGSLLDIARAIAVDDLSLTQWCIEKHGGRERYNSDGVVVAIVPLSEKRNMDAALLELRFAAGRISA